MKVKIAAAISLVILLVGSASAWWFYWPEHVIQNHVKNAVDDPESALFTEIVVNRNTGGGCGFVNSKNKLGGYDGKKPFTVSENGAVLFRYGTPNIDTNCAAIVDPTRGVDYFVASRKKASECFDIKIAELSKEKDFVESVLKQCPERQPDGK